MFEVKVTTHFSAAHQLNLQGRKCENLHGHNWRIEVSVAGNRLDDSGLLIDFGIIKDHLTVIMDKLDHKYLNDLDYFDGKPSAENIARFIAEDLQKMLEPTDLKVTYVSAWETENSCVTYRTP